MNTRAAGGTARGKTVQRNSTDQGHDGQAIHTAAQPSKPDFRQTACGLTGPPAPDGKPSGRPRPANDAPRPASSSPPPPIRQSQRQPLLQRTARIQEEPSRPPNRRGRANAPAPFMGLDAFAAARAATAYKEESGKWDGLIEAAAQDMSLSREQRAAAIAALRLRQQAAANGARRRVMEEEQHKAKAYRRKQQQQQAALGN